MNEFTVLDLFSGIGGFALAIEWTGGRTLAFAEVAAISYALTGIPLDSLHE